MPVRRARPRRATIGALLLAVLAALVVAPTAPIPIPSAAVAAGRGGDGAFPAPLLAPVLSTDQPPSLQFTGFYAEPAADASLGTTLVVVAREPLEPPDGYRLSVGLGDPGADHDRATLAVEGGQPVGRLERVTTGTTETVGDLDVDLDGATARLTVPADALPDDGVAWLDADDPAAGASLVGSLVPLEQLLDEGPPGVLTAADVARLPDGTPTPLPPAPALSLDGDAITLTYDDPLPTEVAGVPVQKVTDIVRLVGDAADAGRAVHLITVNHGDRRASLVDATDPEALPTEVDAVGHWELTSYPATAGIDGAVLEFDLSTVLDNFGVSAAPDRTAIGVARSIDLTDGTVVRSDGLLGTLGWFEAAAPVDDEAGAAARGDGDERDVPVPLLVAIAVVLLVAVLAWLWVRRRGSPVVRADVGRFEDRARPKLTLARNVPPPAERSGGVHVSDDEQAELDRITETIFGPEE